MPTPEIITIGHVLKEVIRFPGKEMGPVLGSPAAYAAVAASKLGALAGIVSTIGADMPSQLLQPLLEGDVDIRGIVCQGENTRTNTLIYDSLGNKTVCYEKIAPPILFENIPSAYLQAKAALICPMDFDVPLKTIKELHRYPILLMADLGGFGGSVSSTHPAPDSSSRFDFLEELSRYCPIIKVSIEDSRYIFGPEQPIEAVGYKLLEWGANIAIVTLGSEGSIIFTRNGILYVPAYPTQVVDTTGAGDVYCAGFLYEYLKTKDVHSAARFAAAIASLLIEQTGGVLSSRMPSLAQVRERLETISV
jgi:sugar/nucleoside kinase (ribokinase family)